jgi:hypothetical protein
VDKQQRSKQNKKTQQLWKIRSTNRKICNTDTTKLHLTDADWKKVLPEDVYEVTRNADTERPFTGNTGIQMKKERITVLR